MLKKEKNSKEKIKASKKRQQKKAPAASHTKGYYRFSKDFPSVTDSNGFRDNDVFVTNPAKKASLRRKLSALFAAVFVAAFVLTTLAFAVSNHPIPTADETSTDGGTVNTGSPNGIAYLNGDVLSTSGIESVINRLKSSGINSVVIEFKDASGYFYYRPSISVTGEAVSRASDNAASIVATFKSADISVFASVSCFADDIYARNNRSFAAYIITEPESGGNREESLWYDESHAWLSPYSDDVKYYISTIINDIRSIGADGIIFDNVLPTQDSGNVIFPGQSSSENTLEQEVTEYIQYLNNTMSFTTGVKIPYTVMLRAFDEGSSPEIFSSGCDYLIPEIIPSKIPSETVIGNKKYLMPSETPGEFTGDYITASLNLLADTEINSTIIPLIENSDVLGAQTAALASKNINSYMIYVDSNSNTIG